MPCTTIVFLLTGEIERGRIILTKIVLFQQSVSNLLAAKFLSWESLITIDMEQLLYSDLAFGCYIFSFMTIRIK